MSLRLANVTFDCADPRTVAAFWSAALDRPLDPDPTEFFASIGLDAADGPAWYFIRVPDDSWSELRSETCRGSPPLGLGRS